MRTQGWLFDLYPAKRGMVLWWITETGERLRLEDPFTPAFYAEGAVRDLRPLIRELEAKPSIAGLEWVKRWDLVSREQVEVLKIALADLNQYHVLPDRLFLEHPRVLFWNCGIHLAQLYCYERQLFPLAFCTIEHEEGILQRVECRDDPWALGQLEDLADRRRVEPLGAACEGPGAHVGSLRTGWGRTGPSDAGRFITATTAVTKAGGRRGAAAPLKASPSRRR